MSWNIADKNVASRLLLGTAQYPSLQVLAEAVKTSGAEIITVSLRRQQLNKKGGEDFWNYLKGLKCHVLPNTAGCKTAQEAVLMAEMAREIYETNWIKLEVFGDEHTLQPDTFATLEAAEILVQKGFEVFPYCTEDLVLCQRLVAAGCRILMPWGSPIGSGKGMLNPYALEILRQRFPNITLILDAGVGRPSHATQAMELGFDGVLLNSAVAQAKNPVLMGSAFRDAINAGRAAYEAGTMVERNYAHPSTSLIDTPFWLTDSIY